MKPHCWEPKLCDGGFMGAIEIWTCHQCGAHGPLTHYPAGNRPYIGGSLGKIISMDCNEAKQQIETYLANKDRAG